MTDVPFKVIPMSEVEAKVVGTPSAKQIEKVLTRTIRSVSRSDRLAAELIQCGVGPPEIALKLKEMLDAESPVFRWEKQGNEWVKIAEMGADYRTQEKALKYVMDVYGMFFALPKDAPININVNTLEIARDVDNMTPQQMLRELPGALKEFDKIDPKIRERLDKIEEAEVEDISI